MQVAMCVNIILIFFYKFIIQKTTFILWFSLLIDSHHSIFLYLDIAKEHFYFIFSSIIVWLKWIFLIKLNYSRMHLKYQLICNTSASHLSRTLFKLIDDKISFSRLAIERHDSSQWRHCREKIALNLFVRCRNAFLLSSSVIFSAIAFPYQQRFACKFNEI
jgi:hypothetical protein